MLMLRNLFSSAAQVGAVHSYHQGETTLGEIAVLSEHLDARAYFLLELSHKLSLLLIESCMAYCE